MINALFASDYYGGIGFEGSLPWPNISADLAQFKRLTQNNVVVMGKKSWLDPKLPKPLVGRIVYVATHSPVDYALTIQGNIKQQVLKLEQQYPDKIIWVVGGAEILEACHGIYDRIYLTHVKGKFRIDTKVNLKTILTGYKPVSASVNPTDICTFITYENIFNRIKASS